VHIQALVSAEGILPVISFLLRLLVINLASVPGSQLVNSPTVAIFGRWRYFFRTPYVMTQTVASGHKTDMTKSFKLPLLIILVLTLSTSRLFASPQIPDYIIFKGDTIATYNLILEQYLQRQEKAESEKLFGLSFRNSSNGEISLNCWRGYQAIYKIDNDSLFLVDITSCGERRNGKIDKQASNERMKNIFGDKVVNERVYINWFSGDLNFPLNNKVLRWDGVFYKIYEKETIISIAFGKILNVENVNNYIDNPKAIDRKDKSKISDILFKKIKRTKWINIDSIDCSEKYLVTIDRDGKISKVTILGYQSADSIDKYWERDEYNYCINTIFSALKKLEFDIIKDKGKPISEDIYIEIWFDEKKGKIENWTH